MEKHAIRPEVRPLPCCKHSCSQKGQVGVSWTNNLEFTNLLCYFWCPHKKHADYQACVVCAGKIHFVKFETQRIDDCIDFIEAKGLHRTHNGKGEPDGRVRIVATGGGAFKYADKFEVLLHLLYHRCSVHGSTFIMHVMFPRCTLHLEELREPFLANTYELHVDKSKVCTAPCPELQYVSSQGTNTSCMGLGSVIHLKGSSYRVLQP